MEHTIQVVLLIILAGMILNILSPILAEVIYFKAIRVLEKTPYPTLRSIWRGIALAVSPLCLNRIKAKKEVAVQLEEAIAKGSAYQAEIAAITEEEE